MKLLKWLMFLCCCGKAMGSSPNILFVLIDDMGYGDLACYGNGKVSTPNIDRLAKEGIRYGQFYVGSPICSPSRVAFTTGQNPSRWGITSFLYTHEMDKERGIKDYLDPTAPSVARYLKAAGYYTAHVGKWHMGGQGDVKEAPMIRDYGFDSVLTSFEGQGDRILATFDTLPQKGAKIFTAEDGRRYRLLEKYAMELGSGTVTWAKRENITQIFTDRAIEEIRKSRSEGKPFYINLWPDDIHAPLEPPEARRGSGSQDDRLVGVVNELDLQLGRIFDFIRSDPDLATNTLIFFASDNGPAWGVNDAGPLRGHKASLYEGGVRVPCIAWWAKQGDSAGTVDLNSVLSAQDILPTFLSAAGVSLPDIELDGQSCLSALTGQAQIARDKPLMWIRPPDRFAKLRGGEIYPDLAIRQGNFKLVMDVDGGNRKLYDIVADESETTDISKNFPEVSEQLANLLMKWYATYPHQIDRSVYTEMLHLQAR
ncbi:MAG: sulfatase [Kiritimatiellales bacterium]